MKKPEFTFRNDLEAIHELRKVKADLSHYSGLMLEASVQLESIKKENAALCEVVTLLVGDFEELKEDLHPETKQRLRDQLNHVSEPVKGYLKKLLTTEKGKVDLNEAALDYVRATIKSLND